MDGAFARAYEETKIKNLGKPKLVRSDIPDGLKVNVKQVGGGRLQGNFIVEEEIERPKITIAYDIAGNAIECDLNDILEKKLSPTPGFELIEHASVEEHIKAE
tara:strand:+ start:38 stop:346 length:309 start_codon:yes stop_codon:yes gene_type:complete